MKVKGNCSFIAYIDESGDIGINPDRVGASQWFGIAAFVVPADKDSVLVKHKKHIVERCGFKCKDIHMKEIHNEDKRRYVARTVADFDSQCIVVLSNKVSLYNTGKFKTKDSYYQYMSRYLLERITNCCAQWHKQRKVGNGKVKIVFATRGGMNYDKLKNYLYTLKDSPAVQEKIEKQNWPKINWDFVDIDDVHNMPAEKRVGLQFADVLSYSFFKAANRNEFSMVNTGYSEFFKPRMYNEMGRIWHNGLTIVNVSELDRRDVPQELRDIFRTQINKERVAKNQTTAKLGEIATIIKKRVPGRRDT